MKIIEETRTLAILFAIIFVQINLACTSIHASDDESNIRKKLFLIERQLSRTSTRIAEQGAFKLAEPLAFDAVALKKLIQDGMGAETCSADKDAADCGAEKKSAAAGGSAQKDFGSVSAALEGGRLTSFSYSASGLDLTDFMGGKSMVLFLQSNEIDVSDLKDDDNLNDKFKSAGSDSFYGLKEYQDMQNMFQKQAPGKDYTMTGLGMSFRMGGLDMSMINYSKPPQQKKKIFFGNDSAGPYLIGATGIIPGSDEVRVDGSLLVRDKDYTINYSKGEITFSFLAAMSARIIVEYELAQSGGGAPGKFTGFRIGTAGEDDEPQPADGSPPAAASSEDNTGTSAPVAKPKRLALNSWGVSYFTDEVVDYHKDGGDMVRNYSDHTLLGFDGAMSLGGRTEIGFEVAQSQGDKSRSLGRFASESFTIADTHATDLSPDGPYYLDETLLPIIENSDEVRINGELLVRDTDYTLDATYGHLRLKRDDLNLNSLDLINVTWRYLTEEDRLNAGGDVRSDHAYTFKVKNDFGAVTHSYESTSFGQDFLQVGSTPTNQLLDQKQDITWKPADGLDLAFGRSSAQSMRDAATDLREISEAQNASLAYTRGALGFSWKTGADTRRDNLAEHTTDNTTRTTDWSLDYTLSDAYKIGWHTGVRASENAGQSASRDTSTDNTLTLSAKPLKTLSFDSTFKRGVTEKTSVRSVNSSATDGNSYKIKYKPNKKFNISYDLDVNTFANTQFSLAEDPVDEAARAAAQAAATDTAATESSTGNRARKITIKYQPTDALTLNLSTKADSESHAGGARTTNRDNYDVRYKINDKTDLQYRVNTMNGDRSNQTQDTSLQTLILRVNLGLLPGGMDLDLKRESQSSDITTTSTTTPVSTIMRNRTNGITLSAEPLWEGHKLSYEWQQKTGFNLTNGSMIPDSEVRQALVLDIPFIGDSKCAFKLTDAKRSSARDSRQRDYSLSLSGKMSSLFDLQLSWTQSRFTDNTAPEASTNQSELNIAVKGQKEW